MIPFEGLFFFYIMGALLLIAAVLGLLERPLKRFGMAASLVMLLFIFDTGAARLFLLGFVVFQLALALIYQALRKRSESVWLIWLFVLLSAAPLLYSKLSGLLPSGLWGFLGISYLSFRSVQVLLELYDGLIDRLSIDGYCYFLLFFPTISSGPIDRYRRFLKDFEAVLPRADYLTMLKTGFYKLVTGVFYSFVIASLINSYWLSTIPETGFLSTLNYMYAYTFYLFFNFAGYSRMAIGAGYILGIKVPENFDMPFISRDFKDFWSRWHISLSTWFRDYVYSRFVMTSLKKKWFKNVHFGSYLGYIITMGLMGFWHGFSLHLIAYGFYHGLLMCVNDVLDRRKGFKKLKRKDSAWPLMALVTFHLAAFGMLIFSGRLF